MPTKTHRAKVTYAAPCPHCGREVSGLALPPPRTPMFGRCSGCHGWIVVKRDRDGVRLVLRPTERARRPSPRPAKGRARGKVAAAARPSTTAAPKRQAIKLTGRHDFDVLARDGFIPPPTPEMRADLRRRGLVVRDRYPVRVGNVIAAITRWLGIPTCTACQRRRIWLNRWVPPLWGWWR